jgi:hypothetical protein
MNYKVGEYYTLMNPARQRDDRIWEIVNINGTRVYIKLVMIGGGMVSWGTSQRVSIKYMNRYELISKEEVMQEIMEK